MSEYKIVKKLTQLDAAVIEHLGFEEIEISENRATVTLTVKPHMVNSHGYCHGGLIYALADHAFAYAAMGSNRSGVTLSAQIVYERPAKLGETLLATAEIQPTEGRVVNGQVTVTNTASERIASLQGVHYRSDQPIIEGNA